VKACQSLDALRVTFDDDRAVANAGLALTATTAQHLGLLDAARESIRLSGPGAANAGVKAMTVIEAMVAGADCIDDVDVLRAGSTAAVLGHRVAAPSTIGTFLRGFTFGQRPPARPVRRAGVDCGVGGGCRAGRSAVGDRHRLHHL
jgi:hypothetical protein